MQQMMVRISPKRPKDAPSRLSLPWLDGLGRRFYSADEGFVRVPVPLAELLKRIHCNGELTERGGTGPLLFDVFTPEQATRIAQLEEKRALIDSAGQDGNNALRAALAGTGVYTDEDLANLGIERPAAPVCSAAEIASQALTAQASPSEQANPSTGVATPANQVRVGRKPPKGKGSLPPTGGTA